MYLSLLNINVTTFINVNVTTDAAAVAAAQTPEAAAGNQTSDLM